MGTSTPRLFPSGPIFATPDPSSFDLSSSPDCGLKADIFARIQYTRWVGFQNFSLNKAFVVSDAVPKGKVRAVLALSAYRPAAATRTLHFFIIPPQDADGLVNPLSDSVAPIFKGANNNPPLSSGVIVSIGGQTVNEMICGAGLSVNGMLNIFFIPERWKVLCFIDSTEGVTNPTPDGIVMDMASIDFDFCECLPDSLL